MAEAALALIETTISGKAVRMRLADRAEDASEWIEFQVKPEYEVMGRNLFDEPGRLFLAEAHLAAIRRAQAAIDAETTRLSKLVGQLRS
jgi:hypothetical protein